MGELHYKGYTGSVEVEEDGSLSGKVLGLPKSVVILYEGRTMNELEEDFRNGINFHIEAKACRNDDV